MKGSQLKYFDLTLAEETQPVEVTTKDEMDQISLKEKEVNSKEALTLNYREGKSLEKNSKKRPSLKSNTDRGTKRQREADLKKEDKKSCKPQAIKEFAEVQKSVEVILDQYLDHCKQGKALEPPKCPRISPTDQNVERIGSKEETIENDKNGNKNEEAIGSEEEETIENIQKFLDEWNLNAQHGFGYPYLSPR